MKNAIFDLLCDLGVCDPSRIVQIQGFVRDRDDIAVMRCEKSDVIFLSRTDHIDTAHYDAKPPTHTQGTRKREIIASNDDSERRYNAFANVVRGKRWLDVGAGSGAMLDRLGSLASDYAAIEPQAVAAGFLEELGHRVFRRIEDAGEERFDVITLFHVFEHLQDPLEILAQLRELLVGKGRLVLEVPHARDFLISFLDCDAFEAHTFWSEHLILHTRESLTALLREAGFRVTALTGIQRYPLANQLHWLAEGKPGGHVIWSMLRDPELDRNWGNTLARLDRTDTLLVEAVPD